MYRSALPSFVSVPPLLVSVLCIWSVSHASRRRLVIVLPVRMGFLTRLVSSWVFLTRLDADVGVVQRVRMGFLTRLVSDGVCLSRFSTLMKL